MATALDIDVKKLKAQAFHRADWGEPALQRYHAVLPKLNDSVVQQLQGLYCWIFVPTTLWPFNVQDVLEDCLTALEKGKRLNSRQCLIIDMLPVPPDEKTCAAVTDHELHVQTGTYENLVKTQAKYSQNEIPIQTDPELRHQWARIKAEFDVKAFCDHKGLIRRTMNVERNLRPWFAVNMRRQPEVFQAAFDAFCQRWNLFGMQNDEPLLLKLSVNLTPYGTMIHIPAYWSFDPKRDIRWPEIAKLHRVRVHGRQGNVLAEGLAKAVKDAKKLGQLDKEALLRGLKGEKKHEFLCAGLGWDPRTSPKQISRLRAKFKNKQVVAKAK
ncbi:MAG: hypothetical protein WCS42_04900 [Verrucomicrobiota bacterium]